VRVEAALVLAGALEMVVVAYFASLDALVKTLLCMLFCLSYGKVESLAIGVEDDVGTVILSRCY
jgi:hypothetical protein